MALPLLTIKPGAARAPVLEDEAETAGCGGWRGALKGMTGMDARCQLERKRQQAMTRITQLLNMFYAAVKANKPRKAAQLWTALGDYYEKNEQIVKPNFPQKTRADWLKQSTFAAGKGLAEQHSDAKGFQNAVLSVKMGFTPTEEQT